MQYCCIIVGQILIFWIPASDVSRRLRCPMNTKFQARLLWMDYVLLAKGELLMCWKYCFCEILLWLLFVDAFVLKFSLMLYRVFMDVLLFRSFDLPKKQNSNRSGSSVSASSTVVSSDVAASSSSSAGDTATGIHLSTVNSTSDGSTSTKSKDSTDSSVLIDTEGTRKKSSSENLGMFVCRFFNFIFLV